MARPWPARTKVASSSSSYFLKKDVTGTCSARERACSVASEGEVIPFSIFDSMPADRPEALASSATVMSSFLRNSRTSPPIDTSRLPSSDPVA